MNPRPLTITGGILVRPGGEPAPGAVRCVDGRIAALGDIAPQDGDEVIAANGRLVAPAGCSRSIGPLSISAESCAPR